MSEVVKLTQKQAKVIEVLRETGEWMFADEIAAVDADLFDKGAKSVSPLMTHLCKGETPLVIKEKASREVVSEDGKTNTKELTRYHISNEGAALVYEVKA